MFQSKQKPKVRSRADHVSPLPHWGVGKSFSGWAHLDLLSEKRVSPRCGTEWEGGRASLFRCVLWEWVAGLTMQEAKVLTSLVA